MLAFISLSSFLPVRRRFSSCSLTVFKCVPFQVSPHLRPGAKPQQLLCRLRAQIRLVGRGGPGWEDTYASLWDARASACHSAELPAGFPSDRPASRASLGWQQHCCISYQQIIAAITCSLLEVVSLFWLRVNSISGM